MSDTLARGLFWQAAIQDVAGLAPSTPRAVTLSAIMTLLAQHQGAILRPTDLLVFAVLAYVVSPHNIISTWAARVMVALQRYRQATGGYSVAPGLPADLISTRAAVAVYRLLQRQLPHLAEVVTFVTRCMNRTGGFDAVLPGTPGASTNTRSLYATWAGVSTLQMLAATRTNTGSWIQRVWGVGGDTVLPTSVIGN